MRFRNLSNMLSHFEQLFSSILAHLFGIMPAYLVWLEALDLFFSKPLSTAFLCVHLDTTMDPRCVRAANALVRLCICSGSSELSMFA